MLEIHSEGFRVLPSYYLALRELPDDVRLALYDAMFDCGFGNPVGDLPPIANGYFILIRPTLENSVNYYVAQVENGKKGGRPKKTTGKPLETQQEANRKRESETELDSDSAGGGDIPTGPTEVEFASFMAELGVPPDKARHYRKFANGPNWKSVIRVFWDMDKWKYQETNNGSGADGGFVMGLEEIEAIERLRRSRDSGETPQHYAIANPNSH